MKVCYVTHLPNLTGASQSLLDILSELGVGDYGVEPWVLLGKHGPIEAELQARSIPYEIIRYSTEISDKNPLISVLKRLRNRLAVRKIVRFYQREHFDLIHNNTLLSGVGMAAAEKAGIPYISHNREFVWEDHAIHLLNEHKQYERMDKAAKCIAISKAVYEKFHRLVPEADFTVLQDGLVTEKYRQPHRELFADRPTSILLAGRIAPGKGQREALKAFQILEERKPGQFTLTLAGNPGKSSQAYAESLKQFVKEKDLKNVTFLSFTDLQELRAKTDIALVCSSAEALGRVTIESQLVGCLVIGADAAATAELIEEGETGYLYPPGDPKALAETILSAAEHKEESRRIAKQACEKASKRYDIADYVTQLVDLYRTVL